MYNTVIADCAIVLRRCFAMSGTEIACAGKGPGDVAHFGKQFKVKRLPVQKSTRRAVRSTDVGHGARRRADAEPMGGGRSVVHKRMRQHIKSPRILLLGCAVEYERGAISLRAPYAMSSTEIAYGPTRVQVYPPSESRSAGSVLGDIRYWGRDTVWMSGTGVGMRCAGRAVLRERMVLPGARVPPYRCPPYHTPGSVPVPRNQIQKRAFLARTTCRGFAMCSLHNVRYLPMAFGHAMSARSTGCAVLRWCMRGRCAEARGCVCGEVHGTGQLTYLPTNLIRDVQYRASERCCRSTWCLEAKKQLREAGVSVVVEGVCVVLECDTSSYLIRVCLIIRVWKPFHKKKRKPNGSSAVIMYDTQMLLSVPQAGDRSKCGAARYPGLLPGRLRYLPTRLLRHVRYWLS
eukprot:655610-Rhodomonas_salina.1